MARIDAKPFARFLPAVEELALGMGAPEKALWHTRLRFVYGDLKGQRRLEARESEGGTPGVKALPAIIAIEGLYFLIVSAVAAAAFQKQPKQFLLAIADSNEEELRDTLKRVLCGALLEEQGVYGYRYGLPTEWLTATNNDHVRVLAGVFGELAKFWGTEACLLNGDDPFQGLHAGLFPANLAHITGQFYSPEWLVERLLDDVEWRVGETLVDPFCGSGVVLSKAVRKALAAGHSVSETLPWLLGIDINPVSAAATRATLALLLAREDRDRDRALPVYLNVLSADSLAPAVLKGMARRSQSLSSATLTLDGQPIRVSELVPATGGSLSREAEQTFGLDLKHWGVGPSSGHREQAIDASFSSRRRFEHQLLFGGLCAKKLVTNPPWVGWEYVSRPYREAVNPAWLAYDMYKARGMEAAFLKEDLSNLALLSAWDLYLEEFGTSAVILRPATMRSEAASRGVRRLALSDDAMPLKLERVRTFNNLRVFEGANAKAATWQLTKGQKTSFPVEVTVHNGITPKWQPSPWHHWRDIEDNSESSPQLVQPTDPEDFESRWMLTDQSASERAKLLLGTNDYKPRMGVFTGGANSVFYLERVPGSDPRRYRNIIARAKRKAPQVEVELEAELVHTVVRGRDISLWSAHHEVELLFPHSAETKMYPIPESKLQELYPKTFKYLESMGEILRARNGFAGWEKKVHAEYFHTLQRIGDYTFAPYKVCWKYIASSFTICVLGTDAQGRPVLPNDKVMFIPFQKRRPAFFLAGVLSSSWIKDYVGSIVEVRQMSTSVLRRLNLPTYDRSNPLHRQIADHCERGHRKSVQSSTEQLTQCLVSLDRDVATLFGI